MMPAIAAAKYSTDLWFHTFALCRAANCAFAAAAFAAAAAIAVAFPPWCGVVSLEDMLSSENFVRDFQSLSEMECIHLHKDGIKLNMNLPESPRYASLL